MAANAAGRFTLKAMLGAMFCWGIAAGSMSRFFAAEDNLRAMLGWYELGAISTLAGFSLLVGFRTALAMCVAVVLIGFGYWWYVFL